jgi:hypothetical protein
MSTSTSSRGSSSPSLKHSVPHLCGFFLAQGWETSNLSTNTCLPERRAAESRDPRLSLHLLFPPPAQKLRAPSLRLPGAPSDGSLSLGWLLAQGWEISKPGSRGGNSRSILAASEKWLLKEIARRVRATPYCFFICADARKSRENFGPRGRGARPRCRSLLQTT